MKPELRIVWLAALLVPRTSASEVDSISNLRPNNITGLAYYLYRYTGSYYNGTTTIRIEPQDWVEDDRCDTFSSTPIEITYQNSLLGILKSNGYYRETNPDEANTLAFLLKFWEEGLNIEPTSSSSDGPINDISTIASEQMERNAKPINIGYPTFWRINSSHIADSSYSFQGYRNATNSPQWLGFNSSQCESPMLAEYGGWMLGFDPEEDPEGDPWVLNVTDFPRVSARFDDNSASLEIKGMYGGNTDVNENGVKSYLGGPITISFVGQLDEYRSDQILSNTNGTPIWNQTLGYTKTLTGETIIQSAAITTSVSIWVLGVGTLVTLYYNI